MLSIFARFLSDFAVRNDDFQRENSNPSQNLRSIQISESAKTRGVLIRAEGAFTGTAAAPGPEISDFPRGIAYQI